MATRKNRISRKSRKNRTSRKIRTSRTSKIFRKYNGGGTFTTFEEAEQSLTNRESKYKYNNCIYDKYKCLFWYRDKNGNIEKVPNYNSKYEYAIISKKQYDNSEDIKYESKDIGHYQKIDDEELNKTVYIFRNYTENNYIDKEDIDSGKITLYYRIPTNGYVFGKPKTSY